MKEKIKKNKLISKIVYFLKSMMIFNYDRKHFVQYFINGRRTKDTIGYDLMLEIHKIEKGLMAKKPRPFGVEKVKKIKDLLNEYDKKGYERNFAYDLAISVLFEYLKKYEEQGWTERSEYILIKGFMDNKGAENKVRCGAENIKKTDIRKAFEIDYLGFLKTRHSARTFSNKKMNKEDLKRACNMAILTPSACNRQMCKVYLIENAQMRKAFESTVKGLSMFDLKNASYLVVTFDVGSFYYLAERNQGWLNAGLFAMNLVNGLHSLGIGSCITASANSPKEEESLKKALNIGANERIATTIVCGYYDDKFMAPVSSRKSIDDIFCAK